MYRARSRRARAENPVGASTADVNKEREESFRAACACAANGWPVLPGSAWSGSRFVVPGTTRMTNGLRPVLPRNHATLNVDTVASWWGGEEDLIPAVLIVSGQAFRLVRTSINLGSLVALSPVFQQKAGPVLVRRDIGSAFFLVRPDVRLSDGFKVGRSDVVVMEPGAYAAVPPTLTQGSRVSWLVTPSRTEWKPAHYDVVREAFISAVQQLGSTMKARPYVRTTQSLPG